MNKWEPQQGPKVGRPLTSLEQKVEDFLWDNPPTSSFQRFQERVGCRYGNAWADRVVVRYARLWGDRL